MPKLLQLVVALLAAVAPLAAQKTVTATDHRFRMLSPSASIELAAKSADGISSCYLLSQGAHERWLPTQSCAGIHAILLSSWLAERATAYALHRHHHHRLERVLPWIGLAGSTVAIAYSVAHRKPGRRTR